MIGTVVPESARLSYVPHGSSHEESTVVDTPARRRPDYSGYPQSQGAGWSAAGAGYPGAGYPGGGYSGAGSAGSGSAGAATWGDDWTPPTHTSLGTPPAPGGRQAHQPFARERGVTGWVAVAILIGFSAVGGAIDVARGTSVKGGFNVALIIGSIVAILVVRRRDMFPVLVAPPLVYFVASAVMLYIRSSGLSNRSELLDAAINWLVYGFPAIAGATAAVLVIGGIRLLVGR